MTNKVLNQHKSHKLSISQLQMTKDNKRRNNHKNVATIVKNVQSYVAWVYSRDLNIAIRS